MNDGTAAATDAVIDILLTTNGSSSPTTKLYTDDPAAKSDLGKTCKEMERMADTCCNTKASPSTRTLDESMPLYTIDEVPQYMKRNYILTGYRMEYSFEQTIQSLFTWHNELINVWTHLFPFLLFLGVGIHKLSSTTSTGMELFVHAIFYSFLLLCLGSSSTYHLFNCIGGGDCYDCLFRFDVSCICLQILGSYIPGLYFGFYCDTTAQLVYIISISVLVISVITVENIPACRDPAWYSVRLSLLLMTILVSVVPITHFIVTSSPAEREFFLWPLFIMLAMYGVGFLFWYTRFPENMWPGSFDILFHSHQWWHIFVVLAAAIWEYMVEAGLQKRHGELACPA